MNFQEYVNNMKTIHNFLLEFIENEDDVEENFEKMIRFINDKKILDDYHDLKLFLILILKVCNNHYRTQNFFDKISQIILKISENIKKHFSNKQIFNIFKGNKRVLLILIENKIIKIDKSIANVIKNEYTLFKYPEYFYPEIESYLTKNEKEIFNHIHSDFEQKRKIGENDNYLYELIRKDLIDEFIRYINQNDIKINSRILQPSIFETNSFLLTKFPTLIEYSAFFGSVQIFKYLYKNDCELTPSLWIYSIHSQNPELISILIELDVQPKNNSYDEILKESIKCHHIDVTNYINDNFIDEEISLYNIENDYDENILSYSFQYYNFSFIPVHAEQKYIFFYLCEYGYYKLVYYFIQKKKLDTDESSIKNNIFFY